MEWLDSLKMLQRSLTQQLAAGLASKLQYNNTMESLPYISKIPCPPQADCRELQLSSPTATLFRGAHRSLDLCQLPVDGFLFLGTISEPQRFLEMKLGIA